MRPLPLAVVGVLGVLAAVPNPAPAARSAQPTGLDKATRDVDLAMLYEEELHARQACNDQCAAGLLAFRNTPQQNVYSIQCQNYMTQTVYITERITSYAAVQTIFQRRQQTSSSCVYATQYVYNTYHGPQPSYIPACGVNGAVYSSACSCYGITAGTATVDTGPVTTTTGTKQPPVCYQGIDYAFYKFAAAGFPQNPTAGDGCYGAFTDTILNQISTQSIQPEFIGHTNRIGGTAAQSAANLIYPITTNPNGVSVYGTFTDTSGDAGNWVAEHTGYLYVAEVGTYTFTAATASDLTLFWFNQTAVSGWNQFNANIRRARCQNANAAATFTFTSTAANLGQHIPFRVIEVRAGAGAGTAAWTFTITSPTLTLLDGTARANNQNILRFCFDCVNCPVLAPQFSEFSPLLP